MYALKDIILEKDKLENDQNGVLFQLAKLMKEIKESNEGSVHSVAALKQAILTDLYG